MKKKSKAMETVMTKNSKTIETVVREMGEECIGVRIRLLNRVITNLYDKAFRPLGITTNQMSILVSMLRRGFSTPGEIGNFLQMEKSTLSRNLDRMRKSGWLEILQGENGRSQHLQMTSKGRKVVEQSLPLWRSAQKEAKQILGEHGAASVCETANEVWSRYSPR